jgi:hypothetical protein
MKTISRSLPLLGVPKGDLHAVDVLWFELQHLSDAHPTSRHEFEEDPVPAIPCGVDDFVDCFSVDHRSCPDSRRSEHLPDHGTVARIPQVQLVPINDVVEKGPQECAPGVPGALTGLFCVRGQKGKHPLRGDVGDSPFPEPLSEPLKDEPIGGQRIFSPSLPGDTPGMCPQLSRPSWGTSSENFLS